MAFLDEYDEKNDKGYNITKFLKFNDCCFLLPLQRQFWMRYLVNILILVLAREFFLGKRNG
jgi:hypothetical protein